MKRIKFTLIILFISSLIYGQANTNDPFKIPEYIPSSPEAAAFAKYGDVPVSEYTGTPNIAIPIYTVKSGSLSLPISLDYQASGIQVSQEATWVGLAWNLTAGGTINYAPVGANNQLSKSLYVPAWKNRLKLLNNKSDIIADEKTFSEDHLMMWDCYSSSEKADSAYAIENNTLNYGIHGYGQPDIYSVNFLNYSFKFFIHPQNDSIVFIGKKNMCKIEKMSGGWLNGFIITGEDGVKYRFQAHEMEYYNNTCQAWYLTSIISSDGHYIKLNYKEYGYYNAIPSINEQYVTGYQTAITESRRDINLMNYQIKNLYLTSIVSENDSVIFDVDNGVREDLSGNGPRRLASIRVHDKISNKDILKENFSYDYFLASSIGGNYLYDDSFFGNTARADDPTLGKRLKLTGISRYDINNNKSEVHSFAYYDNVLLPLKTSFARDYWGYYNGQENVSNIISNLGQHTLIPDKYSISIQPINSYNKDRIQTKFPEYKGANRGTSTNYITAGMLQSITYPTGGKTVFEFEPHSHFDEPYLSAEDTKNLVKPGNYSVSSSYKSVDSISFTLNNQTLVKFTGNIRGTGNNGQTYPLDSLAGASILLIGPFGSDSKMKKYDVSRPASDYYERDGKLISYSDTITLAAGHYLLMSNLPSPRKYTGTSPLIDANISYTEFNASLVANATPIGGGLRVKTISNYDKNNNIVSKKQYTYKGGRIIVPLKNFLDKYISNAYRGQARSVYSTEVFSISSENYMNSPEINASNIVGYDAVEIQTVCGSINNGKEIINFRNEPMSYEFNKIPIFGYNSNGEELGRIYLNATNDTVHSEKFVYAKSDLYNEKINYTVDDNYIGTTDDCFDDQFGGPPYNLQAYIGRFTIGVYTNKNFWNYLSKKEETDYFGSKKVTKTTNYTYNPINYCISQITETRSDGHLNKTTLKYPSDFSSIYPYSSMLDNNMISPVIEKSFYRDSTFLKRIKTNYWPPRGDVPVPLSVEEQVGEHPTKVRLNYYLYDSHYNPVYVAKDSINREVYLWSYNYQYPIAKIQGLAYNDVLAAGISQTFIDNLSATSLPTPEQYNTIRAALADKIALVSTYTYQPLVGTTSMTNPRGVTTTYNYDTFNRLYLARDDDKNIVARYQYAYQNSQDNTGQGGYTALVGSLTLGSSSYIATPNSVGTATLTSVSGGSGSYNYSWYLKNNSGGIIYSTLNSTSTIFSYPCTQEGILTVQCLITDNTTGQSVSNSQTVPCFSLPTATVSIGASYYLLNSTGSATVAVGGGSGNFSYSWSINGVVQTGSTSSSLSFTASQVGTLTIKCVIIDNVTGQTSTDTKNVNSYTVPTASVAIGASYYMVNGAGTATATAGSGSGNFSYSWFLNGTLSSIITSTFSFTASTAGTQTIKCIVTDNTTGQTATDTKTVNSYSLPTGAVSIVAPYYMLNNTGNASVTAGGGSGNYSYSWSLIINGVPTSQSGTSSSFSFTVSQTGAFTLICVVTDNITGKTVSAGNAVNCYTTATVAVTIGASYYLLNGTGSATVTTGGGSNNFSYAWSLKNSGGTVFQTGTSSSFSYTCSQSGTLTVQCVVTDNTTGQPATDSKTVICYSVPTATVATGATYYKINDTGSATVTATSGSGSYAYSWSLKNSSGTVLQSATTNSFSYTCSQAGILTVQCVVTDNATGQTVTATKTVPCYSSMTASTSIGASYYLLNSTGSGAMTPSGGSGNYVYNWYLKNSAGATLQSGTTNPFTFTCSQAGTLTVQFVTVDNTTGQTIIDNKTVPCYSAPSATVSIGASYYLLNGAGSATVATSGGSTNFSYSWTLKNSGGTVLQTSTSSAFSYTASQAGALTVQCVVTDNTTGQTATDTKTVTCYTLPTATVSIGAAYYMLNGAGSATVTAGSGSGNYSYSWSLKNSGGTVLQTGTSSSFSFTASQAGVLTVQCVVTDNTTGQTVTDTKTVNSYSLPTANVVIGALYYMLNGAGSATVSTGGGSTNFSYAWSLKNSGGTVLQTGTASSFSLTASQAGVLTVQCVVTDNTTGITVTDTKTVNCYSLPTGAVSIAAPYYILNNTGNASVTAGGGSGNYSYSWSLIINGVPTSQSGTSSSFSFTASQTGALTPVCVVTDNITGKTVSAGNAVNCYTTATAAVTIGASYYLLNGAGSATVTTGGGSNNFSYAWSLKNSGGTVLQSGTSSSFSFTASQAGVLTVQCVVTDNTTGQTVTNTKTVTSYTLPTATVSIGASYYMLNGAGTATVAAGNGSGNFSYSWSLKNSGGTVIQTGTSSSFSFTASQAGVLTVQCVVTDNTTGQTATDSKTVTCYAPPTATVTFGASYYMTGSTGSATVAAGAGSGNFSYNWSIKNSSGTVVQTGTSGSISYSNTQPGTWTAQCVVTDNITGKTVTATSTIVCYAPLGGGINLTKTSYVLNESGSATISIYNGSGNYGYRWILTNSVGTVLKSDTSQTFNFICSQRGTLTLQCILIDYTTGQGITPTRTITVN